MNIVVLLIFFIHLRLFYATFWRHWTKNWFESVCIGSLFTLDYWKLQLWNSTNTNSRAISYQWALWAEHWMNEICTPPRCHKLIPKKDKQQWNSTYEFKTATITEQIKYRKSLTLLLRPKIFNILCERLSFYDWYSNLFCLIYGDDV